MGVNLQIRRRGCDTRAIGDEVFQQIENLGLDCDYGVSVLRSDQFS